MEFGIFGPSLAHRPGIFCFVNQFSTWLLLLLLVSLAQVHQKKGKLRVFQGLKFFTHQMMPHSVTEVEEVSPWLQTTPEFFPMFTMLVKDGFLLDLFVLERSNKKKEENGIVEKCGFVVSKRLVFGDDVS